MAARRAALRARPARRIEPERRTRFGYENARLTERSVGGAVEENGIPLRKASSQLPQDMRRQIELADAGVSR